MLMKFTENSFGIPASAYCLLEIEYKLKAMFIHVFV